jgi:hypothetical protein
LERAGWQIEDVQPRHVVASDGARYGVTVFFEESVPVGIEYGDGEIDMQSYEERRDARSILRPTEVAQLFSADEEGEQG